MKRQEFVLGGAVAVSLAGCAGHGASVIPGGSNSSFAAARQPSGMYSPADQDKYAPVQPLPKNPILGEVRRFDGAKAPAGWAFCDGSLLSIKSNAVLYNQLGAHPSSKGATTFALPQTKKFAYVIAIAGATPKSPRDLAAIFAARPPVNIRP